MTVHGPELLAPAGDEATIGEAVRAGADAVYFGLATGFNARARAENVELERLPGILQSLHERGKRGYLTLNTLVFDSELDRLEELLGRIAEAGVDAVIVQDLGLARWVKTYVPSLRLHASTQMTCTDRASIELARTLGASRVTLARELPLSEIAQLAETRSIELEMFAHGALCVSYSGQCLTSEAIGGRSANRGACAQACRLPYELLVDGLRRELQDQVYLLSPLDLDTSSRIPEIIASGVRAIKIEGRLKSPDYVRATTYLYRRAIDAALGRDEPLGDSEREASHQTFSRGACSGFIDGADHQRLVDATTCDHVGVLAGYCLGTVHRGNQSWLRISCRCSLRRGDGLLLFGRAHREEIGGRVWGLLRAGQEIDSASSGEEVWVWLGPDRRLPEPSVEGRVYRTSAPRVLERNLSELSARERRVDVAARLAGQAGQSAQLTMTTEDGRRVEVAVEGRLEIARTRPLEEAVAFEKVSRLGDTPYQLSRFAFEIEAGTTLSLSALNQARRAAVHALGQAAKVTHETISSAGWSESLVWPTKPPPASGLFVTCRTLEQASAALEAGVTGIYLDFLALVGLAPALRELRQTYPSAQLGIALPRIRRSGDDAIERFVLGLNPDLVLVRSLGCLFEFATPRGVESASEAASERGNGDLAHPLLVADFSLNVTNTLSIMEVLDRNVAAFTPSYDLDEAQLLALLDSPLAAFAEVVIHHPMPLFHTEHCLMAARLSTGKDHRDCGRPCEKHQVILRDRTGLLLPVEADVTCRNTVFCGKSQSGMNTGFRLRRQGVGRFRIELLRESQDQTRVLVEGYRDLIAGTCAPVQLRERLTAASLTAVKGSLRVVE